MIFNSVSYLLFFPIVTILYFAFPKKLRNAWLLIASYFFYMNWNAAYGLLLFGSTMITYLCSLLVEWAKEKKQSVRLAKAAMAASFLLNLGLLFYFKYLNFAIVNLNRISSLFHGRQISAFDILLPVGISFYIFQALGYTMDVYRGKIKACRNFFRYALFVSFFPQLVAGPIVRARDFIPQIRRPLYVSSEMFGQGIFLIVSGLFKKAVISDYISVNFVERIFDNPGLYSGVENLFGVYGYALQIYCDFSGYSDMAIGIALLLGFRFPINFNSPYKSDSVTDFWHRWHISLSTWLRDYLYISLGGNRKGKFRTYVNLILTMLLGGLWHGASWNFIVWGGLHGVALAVHKFFRSLLKRPKTYRSTGIRRFFAVLITFHFVCFCWIFFRNTTFEASLTMIRQIGTAFHPEVFVQLVTGYWKVFALMGVGYLLHWCPDRWQDACGRLVVRTPLVGQALLLIALIWLVIQVKSSDIQPFIYFQF